MFRIRAAFFAAAILGLGAGTVATAAASTATTARAPAIPALTQIQAAHHPGYDRMVFQFSDGLPGQRTAGYVSQVTADPSGKKMNVAGNATLLVRFSQANGHNSGGRVTYGPAARTYALPQIIQCVNAGDYEAVLRFGIGVAAKAPFHMFTMINPSRVVIDIAAPYRTVTVRDYFLDTHRYQHGWQPYTRAVIRPVIPPATAYGALQRLFAGPTQQELASGLRFVNSGATGFKNLTIRDGVARVQLTGAVSSHGSTYTIADEIMRTLKQFPSVHWVKIFDQYGHTERPYGHSNSIPVSLEP